MSDEWLDKARALRAEAWDAVLASQPFVAFKKFDDLVMEMGGTSAIPSIDLSSDWKATAQRSLDAAAKRILDHKKLSQGDAAELALRQNGEPLPIGRLIEKVTTLGLVLGGADPVANFRSMMSKDDRFYTIRRGNMYFWWLQEDELTSDWLPEAEPVLLLGADSHRHRAADDG
ncbi:hypothetical protein SOM26_04060 [Sphingomonas sp. CFBP8993]|uniref:hypothetical protein n=1 Tax=Sphingomonas sp. CFBP8993 TaxID=3096526 RepID=UPI002A6B6BDF|nr:hypothetical protein [Sphingomonas sp. CFBP8993]MDY0957854.1 hypothetical protein [Sphingomonas sp. CFBP8993]